MDNQDNELQDSQQPDGNGTDQKPEPTLEDYHELERKNKELYARAKKAEEAAKKVKLEPAFNQPAESDPKIADRLDRIELSTKGYNDAEVDFIMRNGGKKAIEDEWVKTAIDSKRSQARAEAATVDTDSAKSDIEKQYTQDQLKNMSASELEKILPKA